MKWLKKLDHKLESVVEQFDRATTEPVLKLMSGEVFANHPGELAVYEAFASRPKQANNDGKAAQSVTAPCGQPAAEIV